METDWWKVAVDSAQIVSAVATTAAVVVSLMLARRSEKQRPKIFIGFSRTIQMSNVPGEGSQSFDVSGTVVNAGILPFWVKSMHLYIPRKSQGWSHGGRSNIELQHGRQEVHLVRVTAELHWQEAEKFIGWMPNKRPRYSVTTSLGKTYTAKMTYKQVKTLRRMIRATVTGDFSGKF